MGFFHASHLTPYGELELILVKDFLLFSAFVSSSFVEFLEENLLVSGYKLEK